MLRMVLGIAIAITAMMPAIGMADDQAIADYIKSRLQTEQQRGNLRGFNVDMRVDRGTVWFKGYVSNEMQEMMILQTAQKAGHLGVVQVVDDIEVRATAPQTVAPTVYEPQQSQPQAAYQAGYQPAQTAPRQVGYQETAIPNAINTQNAVSNGTPLPFAQAGNQGVPAMQASAPMANNMGAMAAGGMVGGGQYESPNLPGYAWPGYAAHPNYAAVTYPRQHSASAWPYIGPFYPYPQVPLGWRKVSLEWDDGWWMLDFHDK